MTRRLLALAVIAAAACSEPSGPAPRAAAVPALHVGVQPRDLPLGRVENDFECHIGQRGFPTVNATESHVVESASGNLTLTCEGWLPAGSEPSTAVVETGLLCFLPEGRSTRQAIEVFAPSGRINLTCWFRS
ncbi:MAG: hypothetical protein ACJ8AO_08220 [Gemmatimonadaceae bacterium]